MVDIFFRMTFYNKIVLIPENAWGNVKNKTLTKKYKIFDVYLHVMPPLTNVRRTVNMQIWCIIIKIFILKSLGCFK